MIRHQTLWFVIVGSIGFIVDAGLTQGLSYLLLHPIAARIPAIGIAVFVTFLLNRKYTFQAENTSFIRGLCDYVAANIISQGFNFGLYSLLVMQFAVFAFYPFAAVMIGSLAAMGVSFALSKYWVFRAR